MKINMQNTAKVLGAINTVEHRCSARCIGDLDAIVPTIEKHQLLRLLPKAYWTGLSFRLTVGFGGRISSSYNGTPMSTYIILTRSARNWFLTGAGRALTPSRDRVDLVTQLTNEQAAWTLSAAVGTYHP